MATALLLRVWFFAEWGKNRGAWGEANIKKRGGSDPSQTSSLLIVLSNRVWRSKRLIQRWVFRISVVQRTVTFELWDYSSTVVYVLAYPMCCILFSFNIIWKFIFHRDPSKHFSVSHQESTVHDLQLIFFDCRSIMESALIGSFPKSSSFLSFSVAAKLLECWSLGACARDKQRNGQFSAEVACQC